MGSQLTKEESILRIVKKLLEKRGLKYDDYTLRMLLAWLKRKGIPPDSATAFRIETWDKARDLLWDAATKGEEAAKKPVDYVAADSLKQLKTDRAAHQAVAAATAPHPDPPVPAPPGPACPATPSIPANDGGVAREKDPLAAALADLRVSGSSSSRPIQLREPSLRRGEDPWNWLDKLLGEWNIVMRKGGRHFKHLSGKQLELTGQL